jgi:hypothetical protein
LLTIFLAFAGGDWGLGDTFLLSAIFDKESVPTLDNKVSSWPAPSTRDEIGIAGIGDSSDSPKLRMCEMKLFKVSKESEKEADVGQHPALSGAGLTVLDVAATADKEAVDKRAVEEATTKKVVEERATEETTVKAVAAEEDAGKTADEAVGATEGSPPPGQAPSAAGAKRAAAPSGSTPPAKRPYRGV